MLLLTCFSIRKRTQKIHNLLWFFNIGLSGKNGVVKKGRMKTLETLLKDNKHTDVSALIHFLWNAYCYYSAFNDAATTASINSHRAEMELGIYICFLEWV